MTQDISLLAFPTTPMTKWNEMWPPNDFLFTLNTLKHEIETVALLGQEYADPNMPAPTLLVSGFQSDVATRVGISTDFPI